MQLYEAFRINDLSFNLIVDELMDAFKIFVTEMMKPFKLPGQIVNEAMPELYEDDSYKFIYIFGPHLKPIVFFFYTWSAFFCNGATDHRAIEVMPNFLER